MTGGVARPRGTRPLGPLRLGSIRAPGARCHLEGTGLVDPARHPEPTPAAPVAAIGAAVVRGESIARGTPMTRGTSVAGISRLLGRADHSRHLDLGGDRDACAGVQGGDAGTG